MAGNHKVEIIVGVKDLASRAFGNISRSLQNMTKTFGGAGSMFGAFNRTLDSSITKLDRMANSMYKFNMYTSDLQRNLRNIAALGAIGAGAIAYQGANSALQFDYKTHQMQTRLEGTSKQRKQIEDYILKDLNYKVTYTPTQLADMGVVLAQGGVSNTADLKSMLKSTSYFSEAVDAVPEQAAEMIIAASKGFNISMANSSQITDKLTVALNKSLLHVEEMPHAIGELAGRANMFGQSFDSSLTALMTMRDAGMSAAQGSQDFLHGLRQASRIGNDAVLFKRTQSYFDKLGIGEGIFNKDTRKLKEYPELIAVLEQAMIKQGFTNSKYDVKNLDDFHKLVAKNGGVMPQDFWDSMKAMPLITRVFGAAGQAPIIMGLQSQYEEVDGEGNKTGQVYYGSEAIKRRYQDVKNSGGAVNAAHGIMADSGLFQVEILKGAWEAAQIEFMNGLVPVIKTGSQVLTSFLNPKSAQANYGIGPENKPGLVEGQVPKLSGYEKFENAFQTAADNFRKNGHYVTADVVETTGKGLVNGARIGKTMPSMFKQISDAFQENFVGADWGSNIVEFPMKIVENGIAFINDLLKANDEFKKAVDKLPKDLQDPAKLIETLTKGGIILMVSGAIVKVIELGVRGVSAALKGTKLAVDLATTIAGWIKGTQPKEKLPAGAKGVANMTANVVNVYGKTINGGGGVPGVDVDGKGTSTTPPRADKHGKRPPWGAVGSVGLAGLVIGGTTAYTMAAGYGWSKWDGAYGGTNAKAIRGEVQAPVNVDKKLTDIESKQNLTSNQISGVQNYLKNLQTDKSKKDTYVVPKQTMANFERLLARDAKDQAGKNASGLQKEVQNFSTNAMSAINKTGLTLDAKTNNINTSIVSGFNAANDKLQNIKLQNAINVSMPAAQVQINGNIKDHISSVNVSPIHRAYVETHGGGSGASSPTSARTNLARRVGM